MNTKTRTSFVYDGLRIDWDNEHNKKIIEKHTYEKVYRLLLLFDHYKIQFGDWPLLALRLAEEYHPSLREKKPAGRSTKWDALTVAILKVEIDNVRSSKSKNFSVKAAARTLLMKDFWKNLAGVNNSNSKAIEVLHHHYYRAEGEWVNWLRQDPIGKGVHQGLVKK